jgi:hypothetical protein
MLLPTYCLGALYIHDSDLCALLELRLEHCPAKPLRRACPKPGLSKGEVRVSSLSSTWMESEHEGEQRTSRLGCGGARVSGG